MSEDLRPSRVVVIFPFAMTAPSSSAREAAICRGFGCFLERQIGKLHGVEASLQHLFVAPQSEPESKGWLMTNALWTVDQVLALPIARKERVTHVIQGAAQWHDDDLTATVELIDFQTRESVFKEIVQGPASMALKEFFDQLGTLGLRLTHSRTAARFLGTPPTESAFAFENYLLALAADQAHAHHMMEPEPAFIHLYEAITHDPEFRLACETLELFIHQGLNGSPRAADAAQKALEKSQAGPAAGYPRFRAMLGLQLLEMGEPGRGEKLLERYLGEETSGNMPSRVMQALARLHRNRREPRDARRLLELAVRANPENAPAWEDLGNVCLEMNEEARAEECWRHAVNEDPERTGALLQLARAYHRREDFARARQLCLRIHDTAGPIPEVMPLLVDSLLWAGEAERANDLATEWVEFDGENVEAWFAVGRAREALDELEAARHCVGRIRQHAISEMQEEEAQLLELCIEDFQGFETLMRLRNRVGRLDERQARVSSVEHRRTLEELAERHPGKVPVLRLLARARFLTGDTSGAADAQLHVAAFHRGSVTELMRLGTYQFSAGKSSDAVKTLSRAATLAEDDNAWVFALLGEARLSAGEIVEAEEAFQVALDRDPRNADLQKKLASVRERARNRARAKAARSQVAREREEPAGFLQRLRNFMHRSLL